MTAPPTVDEIDQQAVRYPASLAVLQANVDLCRAHLSEAKLRRDRAHHLYTEGIVPRSDFDTAETRSTALAIEWVGARDRLAAALIEHRRKHTSITTEMNLARSDTDVATLQVEKLRGELRARVMDTKDREIWSTARVGM